MTQSIRRSELFDHLLDGKRPDIAQRQVLPAFPEQREAEARILSAIGLSAGEIQRELNRIDGAKIGDLLLESKAWHLLAERSDSTREALRAGLLLSRVLDACVLMEALP